MSRFYGSVKGTGKTEATRRGHVLISGHVRGWTTGVEVRGCAVPGAKEKLDRFQVFQTGGSNGGSEKLLGTLIETASGSVEWRPE